ncbi:MAG: hypothetical protein ACLTV6_14895, partial [Christensenellales bacterium]
RWEKALPTMARFYVFSGSPAEKKSRKVPLFVSFAQFQGSKPFHLANPYTKYRPKSGFVRDHQESPVFGV